MPSSETDSSDLERESLNGQPLLSSEDGHREIDPSAMELDPSDLPYAGFTWTEAGVIGGVSLLLAIISIVSMLTNPCCAPTNQTEMMRRGAFELAPLLLWTLSTVPIFWVCARLRPRYFGWGTVLMGYLALAFCISFVTELGQNIIYSGIVTLWPPSDPPNFTTRPIEMLTSFQFVDGWVPFSIFVIIGLGRYEYLRSRKRREQAEQLKREADQLRMQLTSARLKALRMQINPHFLFNTLHTISTMAGSHPKGVRKATARLSDMLRYALSTSDQQEVPLDEELDMLDSYLEIQKLRLEDRLETHLDIEPGVRRALVPTLLLQPLAENAVKHGFEGRKGTGHLEVRAWREDRDLVLQVADNGSGLPGTLDPDAFEPSDVSSASSMSENGLGLQNLAERLEGLYGDEATLTFDRSERGGLSVVICLPFHTRETASNLHVAAVEAD